MVCATVALLAVTLASCQPSVVSRGGGPVADYDLMAGVVLHRETDEMAPKLRPTLERLIGKRLVVAAWTAMSKDPDEEPGELDGSLRWLRDYQPIYVRDPGGNLVAIRYLSENPNRSAFQAPGRRRKRGFTWMPTPDGGRWIPSRTLPLLHENGNLVVVGRRVIVSEKLIADNAVERTDPHLVRAGYRARTQREVIALLAKKLLRKPRDIIVVPPLPHEATEHVDVFLLALDDRTVMVPGIEERALERLQEPAKGVGEDVRDFLEALAGDLTDEGLRVRRWPMLPPALALTMPDGREVTQREAEDEEIEVDLELLVYSPANALLLHMAGDDEKLAVLPAFHGAYEDPALVALSRAYTRRWRADLKRRGFRTELVDATELAGYLGLLHCVTASIPAP